MRCSGLTREAPGNWGRSRQCPREAKEGGLCGVHLAGARKRAATDAAFAQQKEHSQQAKDKAAEACEQLAKHGVRADPHYDRGMGRSLGSYDGAVVVRNPAVLVALLLQRVRP